VIARAKLTKIVIALLVIVGLLSGSNFYYKNQSKKWKLSAVKYETAYNAQVAVSEAKDASIKRLNEQKQELKRQTRRIMKAREDLANESQEIRDFYDIDVPCELPNSPE